MSTRQVIHVDRDPRRRPRVSWRAAWEDADNHALSTFSTWFYIRDTMTFGGWRSAAVPAIAYLVLTVFFAGAAFVAAVVAGSVSGSTQRTLLVIAASVLLSQAITAVQNRRPARRLCIVAALRVGEQPAGWGIAWIEIPTQDAARARAALLRGAFSYVEITYYRRAVTATIAAYYQLDEHPEHASILLDEALKAAPYDLRNIILSPATARR